MTQVRSYNGHGEMSGHFVPQTQTGGDFLGSLQDAVRENPVSAALIGMGIAWMFMGGRNVSLFGGDGRKSVFGIAGQGADQVTGAARNVGAGVSRAAQAVTDPAWQAASAAASTLGDAASRTAARATDAGFSGYQATTEAASRAAETISNATASAAGALQESTVKWTSGAQRTLSDLLERQPLLLGAVGLAIGAGIAASLPITEAEKNVMAEVSDFVREKVSEKAAEITGQMKQMADAALNEAKAQGITPETVGDAVQALANKVAGDGTSASGAGASRGKSAASRRS
jgi:hypothetical protein